MPPLPSLLLLVISSLLAASAAFDVLEFVDPLIGTVNGGHAFPGATLPFGMAKAVADVNTELQGGYASDDGDITGFSHMHDSGTGGSPSLGNFPLFPQTGCPKSSLNACLFPKALRASQRVNSTVRARPGSFAVVLNTSVLAEMTVAKHSVLYRFTFPSPNSGTLYPDAPSVPDLPYAPLILADITDLPSSRSRGNMSVDPVSGRITASATFSPSFGIGTYELHFCADFQGAAISQTGVFINNRAGSSAHTVRVQADGASNPPVPAGAWVQFSTPEDDTILARVGLSFLSSERACENAEREIPGWDFDGLRRTAEDAWRAKLGVVQIDATGTDDALQRTFWSGLYRAMISPQDYTGENPLWTSVEPYYDSFYCIWDSFRSVHPLLTIVDPASQTRMVRALIDIYRHEGKLPDCRMSLCKGFTQGGSNADVVLADAYLKGLSEGVDWETGWAAVVSDAEDEPALWSVAGRGGLDSWKTLGYIPTDDFDVLGVGPFTRSISRTVEYAYDDFCIALMARGMNRTAAAETYLHRSGNWANMFNPLQRSLLNLTTTTTAQGPGQSWALVDSGFQGFLQPRYLNGTFGVQDPALCSPLYNFTSCYLNAGGHETYEGSAWLYTLLAAPGDMARLITLLGGPATFVDRLQYLHDTPGLLYFGDEQAFQLVYLFHYAGRPGLSSEYARKYIPAQFNDTVVGIPGNDDSGAMGAFSTLAMMGLWPVAGQDVYLITAPFFRDVSVRNGVTGKTATVRCEGWGEGGVYVQSARLDGRKYTKSWIGHGFWRDGGVLELVLGKKESAAWGTGEEDLPPSASTGDWM